MWNQIREGFSSLMHRPLRVLWCCVALLFSSLLLDGNLIRLWGLHRDMERMQFSIVEMQDSSEVLEKKLKQAQSPEFIEHEARDRFDYVGEHDLVFVFAEEG